MPRRTHEGHPDPQSTETHNFEKYYLPIDKNYTFQVLEALKTTPRRSSDTQRGSQEAFEWLQDLKTGSNNELRQIYLLGSKLILKLTKSGTKFMFAFR